MREPQTAVDRASDDEIVMLLKACKSARDRVIVLLLSRVGLRRGEAAGLRRSDLHLLPDNKVHDCSIVAPVHQLLCQRSGVTDYRLILLRLLCDRTPC